MRVITKVLLSSLGCLRNENYLNLVQLNLSANNCKLDNLDTRRVIEIKKTGHTRRIDSDCHKMASLTKFTRYLITH